MTMCGSEAGYHKGCRCPACTDAHRLYCADWRARQPPKPVARRSGFNYHAELVSANPNPTCRKGFCGAPAEDGSDWCREHGRIIREQQERAAADSLLLAQKYKYWPRGRYRQDIG